MKHNKSILFFLTVVLITTSLLGNKAFASDGLDDENNMNTLNVIKHFRTSIGTTLPSATFGFNLEYIRAELPEGTPLSPNTLSFDSPLEDTGNQPWALGQTRRVGNIIFNQGEGVLDTTSNIVTASKTSEDFLDNITWPNAGEYTFLLTEISNNNELQNEDGILETITYDETVYEVRVWVHRNPEDNSLYVAGVRVWESGDRDSEDPLVGKVDASDLSFTNDFVREVDGSYVDCEEDDEECLVPPTGPSFTNGLRVSKTISGDAADATSIFEFSATLNHASTLINDTTTYFAYVYDHTGARVGDAIPFTAGQVSNFNLIGGQELRFGPLPVGTVFQISENPGAYIGSHELIVNGITTDGVSAIDTGQHRVGENTNYAGFLNTRSTAPITGLITENLPIILVGVATIGLVTLIGVGRKRRSYEI